MMIEWLAFQEACAFFILVTHNKYSTLIETWQSFEVFLQGFLIDKAKTAREKN
jgi:hypothetical protein